LWILDTYDIIERMSTSKKRNQERVTLSMPQTLKLNARAEAIRRGSSLSAVVCQLLEMWMAGKIELPEEEDTVKQA